MEKGKGKVYILESMGRSNGTWKNSQQQYVIIKTPKTVSSNRRARWIKAFKTLSNRKTHSKVHFTGTICTVQEQSCLSLVGRRISDFSD
jgi:hypothetical protein